MIETSYFSSQAPAHRKVCIAKWHRNWKGAKASKFAPSNPKAFDWKTAYWQDLASRFPTAEKLQCYLDEVQKTTQNPILCCFEVNPEECHRHILAAFIREKLGQEVKEWQKNTIPQYSLL